MAVAVVTVGTVDGVNANNFSFNFAAGVGANVAYVAVFSDGTTIPTVSVTYDGVDMGAALDSTDQQPIFLFRLLNPPTGSVPIAVTDSLTAGGGAIAVSCSGVDASTPNGTPVKTSSAASLSSSVNVGSLTAADLVLSFMAINEASGVNGNPSGTGQIELADFRYGNATVFTGGLANCCAQTGTGTLASDWAWTPTQRNSQLALRVIASTSVATAMPTRGRPYPFRPGSSRDRR